MNIQILKEIRPYSFIELQIMFGKTNEETREILNSLSLMNIVRRLSKDLSNVELYELIDSENLSDLNYQMEGNIYVFKFVGIIVVSDICLILYPKYFDNYLKDSKNNFKILKKLISVIRKYESKEQSIGLDDHLNNENFNFLSLVLEMIDSYHEYGLYSNDKQIIEYNGDGEILWEKTINESTAYFSNNLPIYLDTFTTNQENNEQDYFRRLHAAILTESCEKLKDILTILEINQVNISSESLEKFGTKDYILYKLNQELSTQFITHKQDILKSLRRFIQEDTSKTVSNKISFVGTNSFNLVWEDVCSVVFNDSLDKSLKEIGLQYSRFDKQSMLLSDVITKPKWLHKESNVTHTASKTLIPDIISINNDTLSIYDAKYYKIILNEDELKNNPGVGDVTKQYLYELAYKEFALENNLNINRNAFLMPTEEDKAIRLGTVSMELFKVYNQLNFNDIEVILLPHEKIYDSYLENVKLDNNEIF
ncbi:LlaJI family restriction endonuclease [Finegoldia magna]|uniref:LlaJI family restriction endonuclease n=1 Tax=Finegoldia magna TaxID=1260 RepID=UPI00399C2E88